MNDLFENVELESPSNTDTKVKDVILQDMPEVTSPEWNDFVMSHFNSNELIDGMPLSAGLRRVAELLIGRIMSSGPSSVFPPKEENSPGRATVVWKVDFQNGMSFSDVADSWEGNTDDTYVPFNMATAATRAEGRALRKALRLRVIAAEESTKKNTAQVARAASKAQEISSGTQGEYNDQDRMTDSQANFINIKCSQLDINVKKLFSVYFKVNSIRKVTKSMASKAIEKINDLQNSSEKLSESIVGYEPEWRT
jgi:hypothetical protein